MSRHAQPAPDAVDFDRFAYRVIRGAYLDATAIYWVRRAAQLEAARPLPGDFTGTATREELSAQWQRLTDAAKACRNRAGLLHASVVELDQTLTDIGHAVAAA